MKYTIVTFGCRVNQADSLQLEEQLMARGGVAVAAEHADLVVVNTCSVTATADQGARQAIRRIARQNPGARIMVTGCYATREPDQIAALPGVVRVFPNDSKETLVREMFQTTSERFGDGDGPCGQTLTENIKMGSDPIFVAGRTAYTLRVQTGCTERCSYCIIPSTRGTGRSRQFADILADIERVCAAGFREIALTGVHLGSYGRDLDNGSSLLTLLEQIERRTPDGVMYRISSLEPMDCSDEIVSLVAQASCFAPHVHLPLQHASARILRAMQRPYTPGYYRALVDGIRLKLPDASIGSDVIIGFPGETEEDFDELVSYLEESPLTHLHVFPYSDRPGTVAATLPSKVDGSEIRRRGAAVRNIGQMLRRRFHDTQVGTVRRGLTIEDGSLAVTDNYLKVRIPPGRPRNEWVSVRLLAAGDIAIGEVVAATGRTAAGI